MFNQVRVAELTANGRTAQFDGDAYGANVSFFLVDVDPGEGPRLHFHTYPETWIVNSGVAEFVIGNARAGDILVVPPRTPHKFTNSGSSALAMVCIHANGLIEQEDIEET